MSRLRYENPQATDLASAQPIDGPPGSDYELLVEQALEATGVERAILMFDRGMLAPAITNYFFATAVVKAINDWNLDRWLSRDSRLYGVALIPVQIPDEAAAEIRRVGSNPKIAGVLMGAGLGKLFGHPLYYPIYQAAAELDLPIVIHRGLDAIPETETSSGPAGGPPLTFAEYDTISPLAVTSQVLSMITGGVFERFPRLRVCLVGTGVTWIPSWLRRLEILYKAERRDVPWMRRHPTEYVQRHVRVSTYGLELGGRGMLQRFLAVHPELSELLVYGSGYPSWDTDPISDIENTFPVDWHDAILGNNAQSWFRWQFAESLAATPELETQV